MPTKPNDKRTPDETEAKRRAHEWERSIRARRKDGTDPAHDATSSAAVKLAAVALADFAALVTDDLAKQWRLPLECIGRVAAWPKLETIGEAVGQKHRSEVSGYVERLAAAGDLVIHDRRHLRLPSVYMLATSGVPLRLSELGNCPSRTEASWGNTQLEPAERVGEVPLSELGNSHERVGEFPNANPSSDPIRDPGNPAAARAGAREAAAAPRVVTSGSGRVEHLGDAQALLWRLVHDARQGPVPPAERRAVDEAAVYVWQCLDAEGSAELGADFAAKAHAIVELWERSPDFAGLSTPGGHLRRYIAELYAGRPAVPRSRSSGRTVAKTLGTREDFAAASQRGKGAHR